MSDAQEVGPPIAGVEILVGGASNQALRRLVRHGHGYVAGGIKPEFFSAEAAASLAAWSAAGRAGRPRLVAGAWYASSEDTNDAASAWIASYFTQGGPPGFVNAGISRGRDGVRAQILDFRAAGADEVIMFPCVAELSELEWLMDVVSDLPDVPAGEPVFPTGPMAFDPHAIVPGTNGVRVYPSS